jgi:NADH-quinone oxidoreductase subunit J
MVLFVFVVMLLNAGEPADRQEHQWLNMRAWAGPAVLSLILLTEIIALLTRPGSQVAGTQVVDAKTVGAALFGPYLLAVEIASMLLLAGLVGAYHLGRRLKTVTPKEES